MGDATSNNLRSEDLPTMNNSERMLCLECTLVKSLIDDNVIVGPHLGASGSTSYARNPELENFQEHASFVQREMPFSMALGDIISRTEQRVLPDEQLVRRLQDSQEPTSSTLKTGIALALGQVVLKLHERLRVQQEKDYLEDISLWSSDGEEDFDELQDSIHLAKLRLTRDSRNPANERQGKNGI